MNELAIGQLLDGGDADLDDRSQESGERGPEIAGEAFVDGFQRAHLVLADAFGAFEVVSADFLLTRPRPAEDLRLGIRPDAGIHGRQQGIDFRLIEYVGHTNPRRRTSLAAAILQPSCRPNPVHR